MVADSLSLLVRGGICGLPGLGPAADLLSFASPKESRQRKGEPKSGPLRGALRCSVRSGCAQTRLRLKHARPFLRAPLRCSARPNGTSGSGRPAVSTRLVGEQLPSGCADARSGRRKQGRACLSEASLHGPRLLRAPQGARSAAEGHRQQGSPFFAYFLWRSKESKAPAGAKPGLQRTPWRLRTRNTA